MQFRCRKIATINLVDSHHQSYNRNSKVDIDTYHQKQTNDKHLFIIPTICAVTVFAVYTNVGSIHLNPAVDSAYHEDQRCSNEMYTLNLTRLEICNNHHSEC